MHYNKIYKHNKSGKLYALVHNNFMFKEPNPEFDSTQPINETNQKYIWHKGLYLYKALYNNEDSEFFSRTKEDFEDNFTRIYLRSKAHPNNEFISIDFTNKMYFTFIKDYDEVFLSTEDLYNAFEELSEEPIYITEEF